jgi:uncharacterized protein YjiS (DUF1127 family)
MSSTHIHSRHTELIGKEPAPHFGPLSGRVGKVRQMFEVWANRSAERRTLAGLSQRDLKDIGLSRYDAEMESRKPFWRG